MPVLAHSLCQLLLTGGLSEICSRSAYIMDIPFKILILGHVDGFFDYRFVAPCLKDPSLVKGKCTKAAASKAAAVTGKAEFDFFQRRNPAVLFIHRMVLSCVRKIVHIIHFLLGQRKRRRVLNYIASVSIGLCHGCCCEGVCILILGGKAFCVGHFVLLHFFKGGKYNWLVGAGEIPGFIYRSCHIGDLLNRNASIQSVCNFYNGMLSHSIRNQVCP